MREKCTSIRILVECADYVKYRALCEGMTCTSMLSSIVKDSMKKHEEEHGKMDFRQEVINKEIEKKKASEEEREQRKRELEIKYYQQKKRKIEEEEEREKRKQLDNERKEEKKKLKKRLTKAEIEAYLIKLDTKKRMKINKEINDIYTREREEAELWNIKGEIPYKKEVSQKKR